VWSFASFHKSYLSSFRLSIPYIVAVIELDEGAKIYGNIVGAPFSSLRSGLRVRAHFTKDDQENHHLAFRPFEEALA
jgi:uncharacterized OB-fold protein